MDNNVLILDHVSYKYSPGTAYEVVALDDVSLSIKASLSASSVILEVASLLSFSI